MNPPLTRVAFATLMMATLSASFSKTLDAQASSVAGDSVDLIRKVMTMDSTFNVPLKTTGGTQLWTDHLDRQGMEDSTACVDGALAIA